MIRSLAYIAAALALAIAMVGIGAETRAVAHYPQVLPGGIPAVVYEPGPQRGFGAKPEFSAPLPVVVLCHGFSGNAPMMSTLARRLARAGYAVVAIEFRGHGDNRNPFQSATTSGLIDDVEAAILYARMQPHFDGTRVALMGHSMGASAVLAHAQRDPSVAAVIAISGGGEPRGPYSPPNTLLIWASGDPASVRHTGREIGAQISGRAQLVGDRTYGDPERGTAVRISEVDGNDHLSIIYSRVATGRIVDWLLETLGPGDVPRPGIAGDGRFLWAALGGLAVLVLLWGLPQALAPLARRMVLSPIGDPVLRLGLFVCGLLAAVFLLAGIDPATSAGPLSFVPLLAGREMFAFFALSGGILMAFGSLRGYVRVEGLGDRRTWIIAALLAAFAYVALGALISPFSGMFPAPHRAIWVVVGALLILPFFAASEMLLRGPGATGVWLPLVGRLVTLIVIVVGALVGLLPFIFLLGIVPIVAYFLVFELVGYRMSRTMPNPWCVALFQAAFTSCGFTSVMPFLG